MTHIAGLAVTIQGRYVRQRCAWCGELIQDDDVAGMAFAEGSDTTVGSFECGALIRVEGLGNPIMSSVLQDKSLPPDACCLLEIERTVGRGAS